jgi:hypothetical protein
VEESTYAGGISLSASFHPFFSLNLPYYRMHIVVGVSNYAPPFTQLIIYPFFHSTYRKIVCI